MRRTLLLTAAAAITFGSQAMAQDANRLTIHGYLTQAFGQTTEPGTILGVSKRGTTDYRNAALQFRYAMSEQDNLTVQLSHRRLGEDIAAAGEPDVRLDWAFYGRNFGAATVKVGRAPIPSGIYNEIRDVGTLLPLYRAPFVFYLEGSFTSETVDGVVGTYQVGDPMSWGVELSGFAGGWTMTERNVDPATGTVLVNPARVERGAGLGAWLSTPVQGVRVGGGVSRYESNGAVLPGTWEERHLSLDAVFTRATVRAEARRIDTRDIAYFAHYAYVGVRPMPQLTLHGQIERSTLDLGIGGAPASLDFHDEDVLGVSWAFRPNLVLKLEGHRTEGYWAENPAVSIIQAPRKLTYGLISISTSF